MILAIAILLIQKLREQTTNNYPRDAIFWVAVLLEVLGDRDEHAWRQGHVEDPVLLLSALF